MGKVFHTAHVQCLSDTWAMVASRSCILEGVQDDSSTTSIAAAHINNYGRHVHIQQANGHRLCGRERQRKVLRPEEEVDGFAFDE